MLMPFMAEHFPLSRFALHVPDYQVKPGNPDKTSMILKWHIFIPLF